jgi:cell division protein FtsQ
VNAVAAPADRRFRRAHVKPLRRRGWRALAWPVTLYACGIAAVAVALYEGANLGAGARMLQVDRISVRGNNRLSNGEVLMLLSAMRGESVIRTDLAVWRERLLTSPWVKDAALRRSLPSTIEVVVSEREPMALGRIRGDLYLIDDQGFVIDAYGPQYADLDVPIVDGLAPKTDGIQTDPVRAELASRLLTSVAPDADVARRVSQINVADPHDAVVILTGDPAFVHVGEDRFLPRLRSYVDLASALRKRVPDIDYVDLRFDNRIYVRPAKTGGRKSGA